MGQDYDKDLFIVLVGSGKTTLKNFVDNVEDYIFGDRDEREADLLVPYTKDMTPSMSTILNEWAAALNDEGKPNYPIHAFVEPDAGHKSISHAVQTIQIKNEFGVAMPSAAIEAAMEAAVLEQKNGKEVVVVVIYDEDEDVKLVGALKNYNSIPVLNLDGMIDSFPGFKTTDEILKEEREREEFETKEAIRIAAEKEQEKLDKAAKKVTASPRKRVSKAPEEKPLTEKSVPAKKAAASRKRAAAKPVEGKVEEKTELPQELEPVKAIERELENMKLPQATTQEVPDLWADVSKAQAAVSVPDGTLVVSRDSLAQLGEGIKEMSLAYAKTIDALTDMLKEK